MEPEYPRKQESALRSIYPERAGEGEKEELETEPPEACGKPATHDVPGARGRVVSSVNCGHEKGQSLSSRLCGVKCSEWRGTKPCSKELRREWKRSIDLIFL